MSNKPVNGEYFSPFYTINIDTKTSVTQFTKDPEIMKSLSHEYLHFIQDLSLTYNFAYASHVYSKIAHFYNEKKKKDIFTIYNSYKIFQLLSK